MHPSLWMTALDVRSILVPALLSEFFDVSTSGEAVLKVLQALNGYCEEEACDFVVELQSGC